MNAANMGNVRPIAFAIFWRLLVFSFAAGLLIGFSLGFIVGFLSALFFGSAHFGAQVQIGSALLSLAASFFILNWVLKNQIGKPFGGYRLVLERLA